MALVRPYATNLASISKNGLMSASDKYKLDTIAIGANRYMHPISSGYKHIPSGGAEGQILKWDSDGTAKWAASTEYGYATTTNGGLMSAADKAKLDGIATGANKYVLPTASNTTLGGVKTTSSVTDISDFTACPIINGIPYYKDTVGSYTLPTASNTTLGGVKTTSTVTSTSGLTACPIIAGVPYYKKTVFGQYGVESSSILFSVGDGTADNARHNAFEVTTAGATLHDAQVITENMVSNPNLLLNSNFKINQRGFVSGNIGPNGYAIDRWFLGAGISLTINDDDTITLLCNVATHRNFSQTINIPKYLIGEKATFSACIVDGSGTMKFGVTTTVDQINVGVITQTFTITKAKTAVSICPVSVDSWIKVKWVKLELGSIATQYVPPDTNTEIIKCREYYQEFNGIIMPYNFNTDLLQFTIPTPKKYNGQPFDASLKDTSKFNINNGLRIYAKGTIVGYQSDFTFSIKYDSNAASYYINADKAEHGLIDAKICVLVIGPLCPIVFSNEIDVDASITDASDTV